MPDDDIVVIRQPVTQVVLQETTEPVTVATSGPQGPTGPQGEPGTPGAPGGEVYEFTQAAPASTWVINHNLGVEPDVTCLVSGEEVYPDVVHGSVNQTSLVFAAPTAGHARLRP